MALSYLVPEKGVFMAAKWKGTAHRGLRYYEHQTRTHGKQKDKYYAVRFRVDGKLHTFGVGWLSDGIPDEVRKNNPEMGFTDYCLMLLRQYKGNVKTGQGPLSPKEQREALARQREKEERQQREAEEEEKRQEETLTDYFEKKYFPWSEDNKAPNTIRSEKTLFNKWIKPVIGDAPLLKLAQTDTERLKKRMTDAGKSPKTVHLTLALIRQVYNHAKRPDIYLLAKAKMPRVDNAKLRYLTAEEIDTLLTALKAKSETVHDQALLAVNTGLRFSEVTGLKWEDVNYDLGTLAIRDGKTGSRTVFFNEAVREMLKARQGDKKTGLMFPIETGKNKGQRQEAVSKTFQREADKLFNQGMNDRRLRVSFHTLRHSFGSHVYGNTGDLYLTQKALGHKTMTMAQRYAKMSETRLKEAFNAMTDVMAKGRAKKQEGAKVVSLTK
jgi:integrase